MTIRTLDPFEVNNLTFNNQNGTTGRLDIEFGADKVIINCSAASAFAIRLDKDSGDYWTVPSGGFELNCTVRRYIDYQVLTASAVTVSVAFVRQVNRKI